MAALPYMQLYVAEYLADTSHLNAAQHGAYLLLLMNYWQRGKPLPDLNDRLAIVARMSDPEWATNRGTLAEFFRVENGVWWHKRVEADLVRVNAISQAGKIGGMASAKARQQKALNGRSKTVERNVNQQNRTEQIKTENTSTTTPLARRGCRLPPDFAVTEEHRRLAKEKHYISPDEIIDEFRDYWIGVPGSRGVKLDWDATFRNRMREKTKPNGGSNGTHTAPRFENKWDAARRRIEEEDEGSSADDGGIAGSTRPF